jgi:DNA-binding PadR family transcriptional regulator
MSVDSHTELTATDHVVLGMVGLGADTGYAIKRTVEDSIRFFWTISQAQIYPSLERLEREGLLRGRSDPRGRRQRRVYELTPAGGSALEEWLRREEELPFELRDTAMVKLFFADALTPEEAAGLLRRVGMRSVERVRALELIERRALEGRVEVGAFPLLTLEMGVAYHQAVADLCGEFERRLAGGG